MKINSTQINSGNLRNLYIKEDQKTTHHQWTRYQIYGRETIKCEYEREFKTHLTGKMMDPPYESLESLTNKIFEVCCEKTVN